MKNTDGRIISALARRELMARDFISITVKDRITGLPVSGYYWNDVGPITANVLSGATLLQESRTFTGTGSVISIGEIPLVNDLSIRSIRVTLNHLNAEIDDLIRGYDLKDAYVEIHKGFFNPATWALEAPAEPEFVGNVDSCRINNAPAGSAGNVELVLFSNTRQLTRASTEKRSDASQKQRDPNDTFFKYAGVVPEVQVFWGVMRANTPSSYVTNEGQPIGSIGQLIGAGLLASR